MTYLVDVSKAAKLKLKWIALQKTFLTNVSIMKIRMKSTVFIEQVSRLLLMRMSVHSILMIE